MNQTTQTTIPEVDNKVIQLTPTYYDKDGESETANDGGYALNLAGGK
jgi:hypothetical protein